MQKLTIAIALASTFVCGLAGAEEKKADPSVQIAQGTRSAAKGNGKYGTAGCGLGSILFGAKPGIVQIFAATTNGTFANQTFGITSGTSNCDDTSGGADSAKLFIQVNREALAKDIARGKGEAVANLSTLAHCGSSDAVGIALQKKYGVIFPSADATTDAVSTQILETLKSDKSLACTL